MTREDLDRANQIVSEINRINEVIESIAESEEVHLMPEKIVLDGGLTQYVKSLYTFSGDMKEKVIVILGEERNRLEGELADI